MECAVVYVVRGNKIISATILRRFHCVFDESNEIRYMNPVHPLPPAAQSGAETA